MSNHQDTYWIMRNRAIAVWYLRRKRNTTQRSCAVREIFKKRKQQGAYHNLVQEMRLSDHKKYFNYLRMMPDDFDMLLGIIGTSLQKQHHSTEPISPSEMLAVTLRFLASGDSMVSISYAFRLGKSTISSIISSTCKAIWDNLKEDFLSSPTEQKWKNIAVGYNETWNMPNCIGSIDGKHVVIQAPPNSGSDFFNYKSTFSIVLMALCDANYCFTMVDIGAKGRQSDGGIFRCSEFGKSLLSNSLNMPPSTPIIEGEEAMPYFIVGDEAFPLMTNLMRPYPGRFLSQEKRIFNYRLSRARRVIENAFGILVSKWRILKKPIIGKLETIEGIIQATVCLHNYLKRADCNKDEDKRYCSRNFVDRETDEGTIIEGEWRTSGISNNLMPINHMGGNAYARNAAYVRSQLTDYFMYESPIEPQWHK